MNELQQPEIGLNQESQLISENEKEGDNSNSENGNPPIIAETTLLNSFDTPRLVADYCSSSEHDSESELSSHKTLESSSSSDDLTEILSKSDSEDDVIELIRPVEDLKITVSKDDAKEIGFVKHIVDCQVVIEPTGEGPTLDIGSILFLDEGQRSLGRIDDVIGPVKEPFYIVLFKSDSAIKSMVIEPNMKVYYAPKTEHTSIAPVAELMRLRGSDASWKHNREAPDELRDYSDDEEEANAKGQTLNNYDDQRRPKKRNWQRNEIRNRPFFPQNVNRRNGFVRARMPLHPPQMPYRPPGPSYFSGQLPGRLQRPMNFNPQMGRPPPPMPLFTTMPPPLPSLNSAPPLLPSNSAPPPRPGSYIPRLQQPMYIGPPPRLPECVPPRLCVRPPPMGFMCTPPLFTTSRLPPPPPPPPPLQRFPSPFYQ